MSGFKSLRNASVKFGSDIRADLTDLFCAKVDDDFEDVVSKKNKDLCCITSKLRLLQAQMLAGTPDLKDTQKTTDEAINDYADVVAPKLIEQQLVKVLTQNEAVKKLVTTSNRHLEPELVERKAKIINQAAEFSEKELTLLRLSNILSEKERELLEVRKEWDSAREQLKSSQNIGNSEEQDFGPHYKSLKSIVDKMEMMRWLISRLVTSGSGQYDWATDPHRRIQVLALTRQAHSVQSFTDS
ncbi:unnamed protein product [Leptosia nina]|uniref:Centromere protein H C-terminal domain-containing protein n=1 Tax=Leptosia nina TaxID=320188 RepID=A0AAV1JY36_9NEOP